jgi:hypothetical protein
MTAVQEVSYEDERWLELAQNRIGVEPLDLSTRKLVNFLYLTYVKLVWCNEGVVVGCSCWK